MGRCVASEQRRLISYQGGSVVNLSICSLDTGSDNYRKLNSKGLVGTKIGFIPG